MVWQNIMLNRIPLRAELTEALASVFEVEASEILIVKSITEAHVNCNIKILCVTSSAKAQFPLIVEIILHDDTLIPDYDPFTVGQLCEFLNCRALMSDNSMDPDPLNPWSWVLVKSKQNFEQVFITEEELEACDNCEEYDLQ